MASPKALIVMADYGHDPTETVVPFSVFRHAGFDVCFATETGAPPVCDRRMVEGLTQKLLGAAAPVVQQYRAMQATDACQRPLAWTAPGFSLDPFALVFFPGGHDKAVRQVIDSPVVHGLVAAYFPKTRRPSASTSTLSPPAGSQKVVGAVCHGVMVLSASATADGTSVLHDATTTALPTRFEQAAFWGTRLFLGDYYKTYGASSENVEESVKKVLDNPVAQWKTSLSPSAPFVVEDPTYNYISGRWPGDVQLLAEKLAELVKSVRK